MSQISSTKNKLVNDLWIPAASKGASIFHSKFRKNKRMKVLTLTSDDDFQEVTKIIRSGLSEKRLVTGWNYDYFKIIRLDSEGKMGRVLGATRYEDSIGSPEHPIVDLFPFDVINLDFSSQDPERERGRVEKEILGVEETMKLQKAKGANQIGFVLLYTTSLNSKSINLHSLVQESDDIRVSGWQGIRLNGFSSAITVTQRKVSLIEDFIRELCRKYQYKIEIEKAIHNIPSEGFDIYSIACLIQRER